MPSYSTSTGLPNRAPTSARIIPFDRALAQRGNIRHCIFCGQTLRVQTFKGKAVCLNCLQTIPAIFSCG